MIEMTPEANNLPDFCYAHLALVVQDDVAGAVRRALQLQAFKEEYDIRDTPQQGQQLLRKHMAIFRGQFLHLQLDESTIRTEPGENQDLGTITFVHDAVAFDSTRLDTHQKMKDYMGATYYLFQALFIDCEAVRSGVDIILVEYEGFSFTKKQNMKLITRTFSELITAYPVNARTFNYRTGVMANLMSSVLKKILPEHLRNTFHCGCVSEGGRFDKMYLCPDIETASQRVLHSFEAFLLKRYESEKNFTLDRPDSEEPIHYDDDTY